MVVSLGSSGTGKVLVKKFVTRGFEVFTFARSQEKLDRLSQEFVRSKGKLRTAVFDLTTGDFLVLAGEIKSAMGNIDRMVNNAGLLMNKSFPEFSEKEVEDTFRLNVMAVFPLVQHLFPLFSKEVHIVNITSMGGFPGSVKFPASRLTAAFSNYMAPLTPNKMADFILEFTLNGHHYFNGKILPVSLSIP